MNASYATVILFEMAHRWAQVQDLPGRDVDNSSEKAIFDRMAKEFPAMAQAAKLLQAAGFDFINGMGATTGFDALAGDPQTVADTLARLLRMSAPAIVANGERIALEDATTAQRNYVEAVAAEFGGDLPGDAWHLYRAEGLTPAQAAAKHRESVRNQSKES